MIMECFIIVFGLEQSSGVLIKNECPGRSHHMFRRGAVIPCSGEDFHDQCVGGHRGGPMAVTSYRNWIRRGRLLCAF